MANKSKRLTRGKPLTRVDALVAIGHSWDNAHSVLLSTVDKSKKLRPSDVNRQSTFGKIVFGAVIPLIVFVGLIGCQSAQEKASASEATVAAAPTSEPAVATAPVVAPKVEVASAAKPSTSVPEKASTVAVVAPTTAAEPAAKPAVPAPVLTEGIVTAAKAAFESNKCGTCHFVGAFPAVKPATAKYDLGSVGITRSTVWISSFLQKKEKADGKFHMKTFAGTVAEREVLSQWLAAQKAVPLPAKPSGVK